VDRLTDFIRAHTVVIGDGAMGTMLQAAGLTTGGAPEAWNVARPDAVKGIYQGYVDAGSQIITTNTFGGTSYRLARENLESHVHEYNVAGARLAREVADAADHEVLVAGSMGPTGEIMEPLHADAGGSPRRVCGAGRCAGRGRGGLLPHRDHECA